VKQVRQRANDWNPALHPRGPNGQFVERPFNLPDDAPDFGDMGTGEVLSYIDDNDDGTLSETVLDPDSPVTVDGIPDDASSLDDIGDGDTATPDTDGGTAKSVTDLDSFEELSPGDQIEWEDGATSDEIEEVVETEDGEIFAVTEDGFYSEAVALPDDSGRDLTPEAQTLEDDLGIQTADLTGLGEEGRQEVVSILRNEFDEDLREHFGAVGAVTTTPPSDIEGGEAAAAYQGSTRTLYINPDSFADTPSDGELNPGGIGLGPTDRERLIQHELSHTQHFMKSAEEYGNLRERGLTADERDLAAEEVSSYAAQNPHEFVAEVATGLKNDLDFDDDVLDLYDELNGPEVNT
jgi:hypothetical protein